MVEGRQWSKSYLKEIIQLQVFNNRGCVELRRTHVMLTAMTSALVLFLLQFYFLPPHNQLRALLLSLALFPWMIDFQTGGR